MRRASCDQYVGRSAEVATTILRGNVQHIMRNTTRAQNMAGFNAAGFDIAFVNDGGVQVTRAISIARVAIGRSSTAPRPEPAAGWIPAV